MPRIPGPLSRRAVDAATERLRLAIANALHEAHAFSGGEPTAPRDLAMRDDALLERAAMQGYEPARPTGKSRNALFSNTFLTDTLLREPNSVAWHMGPQQIDKVDMGLVDLGLHGGSGAAAAEFLRKAESMGMPRAHALVSRPLGRPLYFTGDLSTWGYANRWRNTLENAPQSFPDLSRREIDSLIKAFDDANKAPDSESLMRRTRNVLLQHGFDRMLHINDAEDVGNISVMFLRPELVRALDRARFSWKDWGRNGLGLGVAGGLAGLGAAELTDG